MRNNLDLRSYAWPKIFCMPGLESDKGKSSDPYHVEKYPLDMQIEGVHKGKKRVVSQNEGESNGEVVDVCGK